MDQASWSQLQSPFFSLTKCFLCFCRHQMSADSKEERIVWCNKINRALANLRTWNADALKPVKQMSTPTSSSYRWLLYSAFTVCQRLLFFFLVTFLRLLYSFINGLYNYPSIQCLSDKNKPVCADIIKLRGVVSQMDVIVLKLALYPCILGSFSFPETLSFVIEPRLSDLYNSPSRFFSTVRLSLQVCFYQLWFHKLGYSSHWYAKRQKVILYMLPKIDGKCVLVACGYF